MQTWEDLETREVQSPRDGNNRGHFRNRKESVWDEVSARGQGEAETDLLEW